MRLLFATIGSLGDVNPLLAVGRAAVEAGHSVRLAAHPCYEALARTMELEFVGIGDDDYLLLPEARDSLIDPDAGFENFLKLSNLDSFEAVYNALDQASSGVDALLCTPFVMAAHLVAAAHRIPLAMAVLSPACLLPHKGGPDAGGDFLTWRGLLNRKRRSLGLRPRIAPQMERLTAPSLLLGLYPQILSPPNLGFSVDAVGYPFLEQPGEALPSDLADWLNMGPFALISFGSFIDRNAEHFLAVAQQACADLGLRCLFVSANLSQRLNVNSREARVQGFVPYGLIMSRAAVVVHHAGTGTLAQACDAGVPMVAVPFALDQTYNASRLEAHGLAQVVPANQIDASALSSAMREAIQLSGAAHLAGELSRFGAARQAVRRLETWLPAAQAAT